MENHIQFLSAAKVLALLDQRRLPEREEYVFCRTTADVVQALQNMTVRGAPAIGVSAAFGCVLAAWEAGALRNWRPRLKILLREILEARPTAVNLAWAVDRMRRLWKPEDSLERLLEIWIREAEAIREEDLAANRRMGAYGAALIADGETVMTHCNAGRLATAGFGTALGVVYAAMESGKNIRVIANETRPVLQGARLTAYELNMAGVPVTIACDSACALLMRRGMVHKVLAGADRIAANGDTVNKIGTYGLALLARAHKIPFYIAAPLSTIDRNLPDGESIPLEERSSQEVTHLAGVRIAPEGVPVLNYAFDLTPAELITGIITEQGILRAPYGQSIAGAFAAEPSK
ncbi:MAG: S-methyl-5-thioribose-1-phosphate isomerase [Desulfovibrio sp.]|jgi:methylthioribose-1-phosphate isomerase|nr:S-methyl-5-thioribose-1-phosphate isomerase [Desulfovibrio sp.]